MSDRKEEVQWTDTDSVQHAYRKSPDRARSQIPTPYLPVVKGCGYKRVISAHQTEPRLAREGIWVLFSIEVDLRE